MPYSRNPSADTESPSQGLISDKANLGNSLLEEWPHNYLALDCANKEVTFSEYSEMRIYNSDRLFRSNKSYSNDDRRNFQAQAAFDASRIRNIISRYPGQTERAIHHAMDLGLVQQEELVGIEHLLCEKTAANLIYKRRAHVASVLRAQELLQVKYGNAVDPELLAKVASMSSSRNVERARVRAVWSLSNEKLIDSSFQNSMTLKAVKKPNIRGAYAA
eukprot:CCRYP_006831-RA/>CCRYP_006831-RA protein AED:0.00 eAED:0.00 QI:142/1/1/1/0/0/2/432/217